MTHSYRALKLFIFLAFLLSSITSPGQGNFIHKLLRVTYDSSYIASYSTDYTTRLYGSVKYSMMGYDDGNVSQRLAYRPNNKLLLGVGVNHGFLGINIGFNLPWVNRDDEKYGETKYYDFTLRIFAPKFNLTGYLQSYQGFYLRNTSTLFTDWKEGDPYYIRGDLRTNTIGLDISYIFNSRRFSYRAAVVQTEWQKKSAGSLVAGGCAIYNYSTGDSSIVPHNIAYPYFFKGLKFNRSYIFSIGPQIGYAYTLVIKQHFFLTGSLNASLSTGFTWFRLLDNENKIKSGMILGLRTEVLLSAGYNSSRWYFGVSYVNLSVSNQAHVPKCSISYDTGMFRINLVRRFATKHPIKFLNPVSR